MFLAELVILIFSLKLNEAKILPVTLPFNEEMKRFALNTHVTVSPIYDTVGIVGADYEYTRDIADYIIKYRIFHAVLIASDSTEIISPPNIGCEDNLFCFVNTYQDFEEAIYFVREEVPFFQLKAYIQFIIGKPVNNTNWVRETLEYIWHSYVLNFIIVYQINDRVDVIGYNPFTKTILNFTRNYEISPNIIFPDKLINLNGYQLIIGMLEDTPRNILVNKELVGKDANMIKQIAQHINASLIMKLFNRTTILSEAVLNKEVNFSYSKIFAFSKNKLIVQASYPVQLDYVIIMVPTADLMPQFKYFFKVFNTNMWILLFASIILMILINMFFAKFTRYSYYSPTESIFAMVQIFLNNPYLNLWKTRTSFKVFLVTWVYFSLLIAIGFSTALRSSLIVPKFDSEIQNLDDLQRSGLKVYVNYHSLPNLFENTSFPEKQIIDIKNSLFIAKIALSYKKNASFSLPYSYVQTMLMKKDSRNRFIYKILDGFMIGGFAVYNFPKNSPFLDKFNQLNSKFRQYGLNNFALVSPLDYDSEESSSNSITLTVAHLQSVFTILVSGYIASVSAFIAELLYFKYGRNLQFKMQK